MSAYNSMPEYPDDEYFDPEYPIEPCPEGLCPWCLSPLPDDGICTDPECPTCD